jgi:ankyrin repeat protein
MRYPLRLSLALLSLSLIAAAERPALVDAAKTGNVAALRSLLRQKIDVNASEPDGTTALHWASYRDDLESADLLIRAGANVSSANDLGVTPLWTASLNRSAAMVGRLLKAGANPNSALLLGETVLMVASRSGNPAVVEQLLGKGANVNARAARSQTALMWAVSQEHPDVVKLLLAHGADVHARTDVWSQMVAVPPHGLPEYNRVIPQGGDTALMFAARSGDLASARLLIAAGANVNDKDAWGVSATVLAAHSGYRELVALLLEKGADPNAAEAGFTALHNAIMRRDEAMVRVLLARGADPNIPLRVWTPTRRSSKDFNFGPELVGATPFWMAARFLQPNVMRLLAEHGADARVVHRADYKAGEGYRRRIEETTALMAATGMGSGTAWFEVDRAEREALALEAVKIASQLGVDINAVNLDGRTALDAAKAGKYGSVVKFLEESGANILSAEERKEGFELLFDGTSLNQFDVPAGQEKVWRVVNGVVRNESASPGVTLLTKEDFGNYVLKAEFRAHPGVNSAIMLRQGRPQPQAGGGGAAPGYELQIRDKVLTDRTGGGFLTGSIVNLQNAPEGTRIVPGQWNTFEVTMNGNHIVVSYNGAKVVDVRDSRLGSGAIGLQSAHPEDPAGAFVEFRNLKIKRLK